MAMPDLSGKRMLSQERLRREVPLGRLVSPREDALFAALLYSNAATCFVGQVFPVCGGAGWRVSVCHDHRDGASKRPAPCLRQAETALKRFRPDQPHAASPGVAHTAFGFLAMPLIPIPTHNVP